MVIYWNLCSAGWLKTGREISPYGLDISPALIELARKRLPQWAKRFTVGNAWTWQPPQRFQCVRTEWSYVPVELRRAYLQRLLDDYLLPGGQLLLCGYGSTRPEGRRAPLFLKTLKAWGFDSQGVIDARSPEHGFVVTRVVTLRA